MVARVEDYQETWFNGGLLNFHPLEYASSEMFLSIFFASHFPDIILFRFPKLKYTVQDRICFFLISLKRLFYYSYGTCYYYFVNIIIERKMCRL